MKTLELLDDYQHAAVQDLWDNPRKLLLADMGAGKTIIVATVLENLLRDFKISNALIVGPKTVISSTWPSEYEQWEHLQGTEVDVAQGTREYVQHVIETGNAPVTTIGLRNFAWLIESYFDPLAARREFWRWDAIVLDESAKVKTPDSVVTNAFKRVAHHVPRFYGLTAKPMPNGYHDLWSQAFLIDKGKRLCPTIGEYRVNHLTQNVYSKKWDVQPNSLGLIEQSFSQISHRIDLSQLRPRNPYQLVDRRVSLDKKTKARYDELEVEHFQQFDIPAALRGEMTEDELAAIIGDDPSKLDVETHHAAALTNKLRQFANGAVYVDKKQRYVVEHETKLAELDEIIEEAAGEPVLIAYGFKSEARMIRERYKGVTVFNTDKARDTVAAWNAGKIPILVAHPASCGHGLNMQHGGRIVVFYTLPWSLDEYEQTIGRLDRRGQTGQVVVYRLIVRGTVDAVLPHVLQVKGDQQKGALAAVGRYISERRTGRANR